MSGIKACLQFDVGNSSAKWRLKVDGKVSARGSYQAADNSSRNALLDCVDHVDEIWVSSVAGPTAEAELSRLLFDRWQRIPWFARTVSSAGSLQNSYEDPARMGVDRWLAMLGARQREAGRVCVVDAGSALTIDIVAATGQHEGGYIIPGPLLMERALLLDTDRVRFDENIGYALEPGKSTAEAVRHGVALAQVGAVSLVLDRAGDTTPMALQFCGGGGEALMALLDRGGLWLPDLVFEGLEEMAATR